MKLSEDSNENSLSDSEESFDIEVEDSRKSTNLSTGKLNIPIREQETSTNPETDHTKPVTENKKGIFKSDPILDENDRAKLALLDPSVFENFGISSFNSNIIKYTLLDIDIEKFDKKPWKSPMADVTDYFNYGFNEETWKEYLATQVHIRNQLKKKQSFSMKTLESIDANSNASSIVNDEFKEEGEEDDEREIVIVKPKRSNSFPISDNDYSDDDMDDRDSKYKKENFDKKNEFRNSNNKEFNKGYKRNRLNYYNGNRRERNFYYKDSFEERNDYNKRGNYSNNYKERDSKDFYYRKNYYYKKKYKKDNIYEDDDGYRKGSKYHEGRNY